MVVGVGVGVSVGRAIGGRLAAGGSFEPILPAIMSTTPTSPRTMGSAQEERRFTWPSLAAAPTIR
jgi:hypothetical protein